MRSELNNDTVCSLVCAKQNQDVNCFDYNPSDSEWAFMSLEWYLFKTHIHVHDDKSKSIFKFQSQCFQVKIVAKAALISFLFVHVYNVIKQEISPNFHLNSPYLPFVSSNLLPPTPPPFLIMHSQQKTKQNNFQTEGGGGV